MQVAPVALNSDKLSISLVEDDVAGRRSLQLLLRSANYEVRAYARAEALVNDPGARNSACLMTDLDMPDIDVIGLLGHLRAEGWRAPAILLTSTPSPELDIRAADAGFHAVLRKPLIDRIVLETVRAAILYDTPER